MESEFKKQLIFKVLDKLKTGSGNWSLDSVITHVNNGIKLSDLHYDEIREFLDDNGLTDHHISNTDQIHLKPKGNKFTLEQYEEIVNPKKETLANPLFNIGTVEQFAYSKSGEINQVKIEDNTIKKRTSLVEKIWFIISENPLISSIISFFICAIVFAFIKSKYPFFPYF